MKIELIDYTPDGINKIARLARATRKSQMVDDMPDDNFISDSVPEHSNEYKEWIEKNEKFVKTLIKVGHLGILEHINFTFHISEVSRALTHQLVRHRVASYLQMSNRHAKPKWNDWVTPPSIYEHNKPIGKCKDGSDLHVDAYDLYSNAMIYIYEQYTDLIKSGIPIEDARYILPPAFYTHISMTMNVRELRHFFELRCDKSAQWEIRDMAKEMLKICYNIYPILFEELYEEYI